MKNTAILVTTFLRDELLFRCIESIRKYYPSIPIFIGDNGYPTDEKRAFAKEHGCTYLELPFDCGVGGTRNEAIKRIPAKYKYLVITEDDCIFCKDTKLETWQKILESDKSIGIAGGQLRYSDVRIQHYEGNLEIRGDTKHIKKIDDPTWMSTQDIDFYHCDLVLNVFMMRLDLWRGGSKICKDPIRWDKQFKTALEHSDFFTNLKYHLKDGKATPRKNKWEVVYVPEVWMYHKHEQTSSTYRAYRARPIGFSLYAKKWGIRYAFSDYNPKPKVALDYTTYGGFQPKPQDGILATIISILEEYGITWWLMCGSALGAHREGDYIETKEKKDDIDIGIAPGQLNSWTVLKIELESTGFALYKEWKWEKKRTELSFTKDGIKVDFFFHYEEKDRYWYGVFGPDKLQRWGKFMRCYPRTIDARLYDNLQEIVFRGMRCWVPNPIEEYLVAEYGQKWHIPDLNFVYWRDSHSTDKEFLRSEQSVYIGHSWDNFNIKHLNLIEDAKKLGKEIILGVISDEALEEEYIIPDNPFEIRSRIVKAIKGISKVIRQGHVNPTRAIQGLKRHPSYLVSTDDNKNGCPGGDFIRLFGGKVVHIPYRESTTKVKTDVKVNTIAIGIKTFLREESFVRCIEGIKEHFPYPYKFYIADDSDKIHNRKEYEYHQLRGKGHKIIHLPFNVGLSAGRNSIVDKVKEDIVLIMDDDILLTSSEPIEKMMAVLNHDPKVGIVAGALKTESGGEYSHGNAIFARGIDLEITNRLLYRNPTNNELLRAGKVFYRYCDQVINFFLARQEVFNGFEWDSNIKVDFDHMDFFLRFKESKWKVAVVMDAVAIHMREIFNREYKDHRHRSNKQYFYRKHGITRVVERWQ